MFLESFRHLIEIVALKKENLNNQQQISSENKRISDLDERRNKTKILNENLTIEEKNLKLTETQNLVEDLQLRLKKLTTQLSLAATEKEQNAFENQITLIKAEIEKSEELYFEKLERSEEMKAKINENHDFLAGSTKTLEEIKLEVRENVTKEELILSNRNKRIDSLLDLCLPAVKSLYLELEKRLQPKVPVSFLLDKKCSACHMLTDALLKQSLEEGRSLETCPSCSRLLIPESARI